MPSLFTLEGPKLRPVACDPGSVDPEQLRIGTLVEMEHTSDPVAARQIALHHLCETYPHPYYVLSNVEHEQLLLKRGLGAVKPPMSRWLQVSAVLVLGGIGFLVYSRARKGRSLFGLRGAGGAKCPALRFETKVENTRFGRKIKVYARPIEEIVGAWGEDEGEPYVGLLEATISDRGDRYTVGSSSVIKELQRCGIGTQLYTIAAKWGCDNGLRMQSDDARSGFSQDFWEKQVRKGRAECVIKKPTGDAQAEVTYRNIVRNRGGCAQFQLLSCPVISLGNPQRIARESKTAEDYARRIEAWNSSEAKPVPIEKLAKLYPKAKPATVKRLINEAREAREEGRERLWSRAARGLRGAAKSLVEVRGEMKKLGVDEMISESGDAIHVGKIVVPKGARGSGVGTKAMQLLVEYADKTGKRITLTPATDFGASSVARLKKFYKRFGFVENKGRNKDYTIRETMFRLPK